MEDRRTGPEVGRDFEDAFRTLLPERLSRPDVGGNVGATEPIDRLLGIADQKQRAGANAKRPPAGIGGGALRLAAEPPEDLGLNRIGVLELVDEDVGEAFGECPAHVLVVAQQVARGEDQVVEIEQRRGTLVAAKSFHHRHEEPDEIVQHPSGDGLPQHCPRLAAPRVTHLRRCVQPIPVGLGEAGASGRVYPLGLLPVAPKVPGGGAKHGTGLREQQRNEIAGTLVCRVEVHHPGQLGEAACDDAGVVLRDIGVVHEGGEVVRRVLERFEEWCRISLPRVAGDLPMTAQTGQNFVYQPDRPAGVLQHQLLQQTTGVARKRFAQPRIDNLSEDEVRLIAIHDGSAGIGVRFDRVGLDQALTESVNGRAGHLVDRFRRGGKMASLTFGEAIRQRCLQLGRNASGRQRLDELVHSQEKLAGGELSERHRGDGPGRHAFCEHDGDAARHDRGLAGAGPCLDQERTVMDGDGGAPGVVVRECFPRCGHHGTSQMCAPSPRRAAAATPLRLQ